MCSVNSVFLDDDPDQLGRFLVAQNVSQSSNDKDLFLRNTTLLPNIPGLGVLLTLIFAPRIELRCNPRRTCYTGALCGLGPMDKCSTRSTYPEHDIGMQFDVEITIDDIKEVKSLLETCIYNFAAVVAACIVKKTNVCPSYFIDK